MGEEGLARLQAAIVPTLLLQPIFQGRFI